MNKIIYLIALSTVMMSGCKQAVRFPPMLVQLTPDKGHCGLSYNSRACGYQMARRRDQAEHLEFTCWNQPHAFHCERCKRESRLECLLELPAVAKVGQPLPLEVRLKNVSQTPLRVDPFGTPLGRGNFDFTTFHMHCDGNDEPWTGIGEMHRRLGNPRKRDDGDWPTIAPGGSIESETDLHPFYEGARGACMVHWHGMLWDLIDADHPPPLDAPENRVVVDCNWAKTRVEP